MAISVFPAPSTSSVSAVAAVPGASAKQYNITRNFSSGIYVITVSDSTEAIVEFGNSTASVLQASTTSGTVTVSLASDCTYAIITLKTSSSASVQINQTASTLVSTEISGTLDTITSSGTYSQTGKLYVLCIGGGGGGAGTGTDVAEGGTFAIPVGKLVYTSSATTVTIGAGGTGGIGANNSSADGGTGGTTSFGAFLSSTGGAGGRWGYFNSTAGLANNYYTTIKSGTTSGGQTAGNASNASKSAPTAGGIGTGGLAGTSGSRNGIAATGYGSGGGGGFGASTGTATGGAGSPGVIYVLRGF